MEGAKLRRDHLVKKRERRKKRADVGWRKQEKFASPTDNKLNKKMQILI
jgi:ribosomal protein L44E